MTTVWQGLANCSGSSKVKHGFAIWKKILEKANCIVQQQPKSENSCAAQAHSKSSKLHNNHKWLPGEHSEERNMYELHEHVCEHHAHCIGNMCDFSESSEFVMFPWDQPARNSLTPIWYYALMSFLARCCIHVLAWSCLLCWSSTSPYQCC